MAWDEAARAAHQAQLAEEKARWDAETAQRYDTPGEGMFEPGLLQATAGFLYSLAGGGKALELGVGTGRVALPLAERGVEVHGLDLSPAMLDRLRGKPGGQGLRLALGDMATHFMGEGYALVYVVFNSISNLLSQQAQAACFRNAARHLRPGGHFVVENFVPQLRHLPPGINALVTMSSPGYFCVDSYDLLHQRLVSHHFHFGEGQEARLFRSPHRYLWPAEMDLMASQAGLSLAQRHADWHKAPFTADSASQVAVYVRDS